MKINGKMIESQSEILQLINEGVNPLEYLEGDYDIDLVTKAIAHAESSEDPFFDDAAEILLKSIVHYLYAKDSETKTLRRCKEILDEVMNSSDRRMAMTNVLGDNESAKVLYKSIEIAPDRTYNSVFDTLKEKLEKIVK